MNYFSLFGLPIQYPIDTKMLSSRFQNLQRKYHPDKFVGCSQKEKLTAAKQSALINKAWKILRNPITRAEYLLSLHGFDLAKKHHCTVVHNTIFLVEQLALREEMDDIERTRDKVRLKAFIQRVQKMSDLLYREIEGELSNQFWENAVNILHKLYFLDKLHRSLEQLEEKMFVYSFRK